MIKKLNDLKLAMKEKDVDSPRVRVKGWLPQGRYISAKFPAAEGEPLVRLSLAQLKNHRFEIVEANTKDGEKTKVIYTLICTSMARSGDEFEIADFTDSSRALQALDAIDTAMNSKKKLVIGTIGIALAWMILFMPLPNNGSNGSAQVRQPSINPAALGMQQSQRLSLPIAVPGQPGSIPSLGSLPIPSAAPGAAQIPGEAPIPSNQGSPLTGSAGAPSAAGALGATGTTGAAAGNEEDPFGLKIGPSGGSAGGPLRQQR